MATSAIVLMVVEVGIFASRFALRVEERNMFGVAPLLFLAFCLWLARGLPRPVVLTAVAALVPAALLLTLPLGRLLNIGILSDSFGLIPLYRLLIRPDIGVDTVRLLMLGGGAVAALAFALLPRKLARVALPSGLALFLALASLAVFDTIRDHSRATKAQTGATEPSWIDEEIGADSRAAVLYGASADLVGEAQVLWQTEFWNRSVGTVYRLGPPEPAPVTESVATHDRLTGRISTEPASELEYVVAPRSVQLAGDLLAQTPRLALYRVEEPLRVSRLLEGVYADGWMVNDATFTHYAAPGSGPAGSASGSARVVGRAERPGTGDPSRRPPRLSRRAAGDRNRYLLAHVDGAKRDRSNLRAPDAEAAVPDGDPRRIDVLSRRLRRPGPASARSSRRVGARLVSRRPRAGINAP